MKKAALIVTILVLAAAVSVTLVHAQNPTAGQTPVGQACPNGYALPNPNATGPGQGAGYLRMGQPCPFGNTQPNANMGPGQGRGAGYGRVGQPCPYGYTQPNQNAGGWWTTIQPTTPEQAAFVERVTNLHNQIRDKQFELANLQAANGDRTRIAALQAEVERLRTELYQDMETNRALRQQMGPAGLGGRGGAGRGQAWQNGAGPGAQQGNAYGFGGRGGRMGAGQGQGRMAGQGQGRMMGTGAGMNPNCPWR